MSRDKARLQDDWDDEMRQDQSHVPTMRPRRPSSPPSQSRRPQPRQHYYKKRSVWPWLLLGCAGGIVILVIAAAVTVFLAVRNAAGGGGIIPVISNATTYTQQSAPQPIPISAIAQMEVHNQVGDITITVDPAATGPTLTTTKKVKATSSDEANKEFGTISVQVLPAGSSLSIKATMPATGGFFGNNNASVDLAITLPPQSISPATNTGGATPTASTATAPPLSLNADTSIGNITVDGLSGALQLKDGIGDIAVTNATLASGSHLETGTGNVTFNGRLDTTPVADNSTPSYKLQSETGKIDVTLPAGTGIFLDANTNAGKITSDFPINITTSGNSASYYGPLLSASTSGSTQPKLTLDVSTGDIDLHQA